MANYKKITDVEVMEEVSENSMALVNENGVLKKVPCGAGFGGGGMEGVLILSDIDGTITANVTYDEFVDLRNSQALTMVVYRWLDTDRGHAGFAYCVEIAKHEDYLFFYMFNQYGDCGGVKWSFDGTLEWHDPAN